MMLTDYPDGSSSNLGNWPLPPLAMQACKQMSNLDLDHIFYWSSLLQNNWSPNTTCNPLFGSQEEANRPLYSASFLFAQATRIQASQSTRLGKLSIRLA